MKASVFITAVLMLFAQNSLAENVHFKTAEFEGRIIAHHLDMTDAQAVMSCHFDFNGHRKQSIRYPQTFMTSLGNGEYSLKVRAGKLTEMFLPGFKLLTCAYKFILIGRNSETQRSTFGEVFIVGQESGVMTAEDLRDLQEPAWLNKVLAYKTNPLEIVISESGGIIEKN